jgi:hypothetical protein
MVGVIASPVKLSEVAPVIVLCWVLQTANFHFGVPMRVCYFQARICRLRANTCVMEVGYQPVHGRNQCLEDVAACSILFDGGSTGQ